jgi:hypothetical protein
MAKAIDGTQTPPHGLFYMENAGGSKVLIARSYSRGPASI